MVFDPFARMLRTKAQGNCKSSGFRRQSADDSIRTRGFKEQKVASLPVRSGRYRI